MDLTEVGLSSYESKVYEALTRHGTSTASTLSADSGVPHSRIYDVLESLIHKGLAKVLPGKTKQFTPSDPQALLALLGQKKSSLEKTEVALKDLKKTYENVHKEPVLIATGRKNFGTLLKEMKKTKKVNYSIKYVAQPHPEWIRDANKNKKKHDIKTLTRYDEETKKNVQQWIKQTGMYPRQLHNEGVAVSITDEEVLIALIKSTTYSRYSIRTLI